VTGAKRLSNLSCSLLGVLAPLLLGMNGEPFRFARPVEATPGFNVLELPDDVLAEARPGLVDLRLEGPDGEIGYVFEHALASVTPPTLLYDVESRPGRETTALLDRGKAPARCSELTIEVAGDGAFLKPVALEASPDGHEFKQIAQASLFRLRPGVGFLSIRLPESDRRFFRLRLDDKNGPAVQPLSATCREVVPRGPHRELNLQVERKERDDSSVDTFVVHLPTPKLPIVELRLTSPDLAFSREARVYESLVFRDELSRRVVGAGRLTRSPDGTETMSIALGGLSSGTLELEVERQGKPFSLDRVTAILEPRRLIFVAPNAPPLKLLYGSATAPPPHYDLADALRNGAPKEPATARLGAPLAPPKSAPAAPTRGPALDAAGWKRRTPITLPKQGTLAYLDLGRPFMESASDVRIVDSLHRQVPFIVEANERSVEAPVAFAARHEGRTTTLALTLDARERISRLVLSASGPAYFERELDLSVPTRDQRGVTGKRLLTSARWQQYPDRAATPLFLPVSLEGEPTAELTIADGDNPPLEIAGVSAAVARRRVDFPFEPGDKLELWSGNPAPSAPQYDLELVAARLLSSPAAAATLASITIDAPPVAAPGTPRWFWWVAVGAGLLVVLVLVRVGR